MKFWQPVSTGIGKSPKDFWSGNNMIKIYLWWQISHSTVVWKQESSYETYLKDIEQIWGRHYTLFFNTFCLTHILFKHIFQIFYAMFFFVLRANIYIKHELIDSAWNRHGGSGRNLAASFWQLILFSKDEKMLDLSTYINDEFQRMATFLVSLSYRKLGSSEVFMVNNMKQSFWRLLAALN